MADLLEVPLLGLPAAGRPASAAGGSSSPAADDSSDVYSGGGFVALSTGGQISSRLLSMRSAAALLELPQVPLSPPPDDFTDGFADENLHPVSWQPAHSQRRPQGRSHQRQHELRQQSLRYDSSSDLQWPSSLAESQSAAERPQLPAEVLPGQAPWLQAEQHFDALWQSLPLDPSRVAAGSRTTGSSGGSNADSSTVSSSISSEQASFVGRMLSAVLLLGHRLAYLL